MKTRYIAALLLFLLGLAGSASAQSLAALARKEKDRRQKISAQSKVITNHDASKYKNGALTTGTPLPRASGPADPKPDPAAGDNGADGQGPDEPVDFSGRTESFWRQTMTDARQRVKELENDSTALVLRLNDLQNRFYREADGFQQQQIQREIQKSFYEQDLNKNNLKEAQEQLNDLLKEARKSGALPGWIQ